MRKLTVILLIAFVSFVSLGSFGCSSMKKRDKGAIIGGVSGAESP